MGPTVPSDVREKKVFSVEKQWRRPVGRVQYLIIISVDEKAPYNRPLSRGIMMVNNHFHAGGATPKHTIYGLLLLSLRAHTYYRHASDVVDNNYRRHWVHVMFFFFFPIYFYCFDANLFDITSCDIYTQSPPLQSRCRNRAGSTTPEGGGRATAAAHRKSPKWAIVIRRYRILDAYPRTFYARFRFSSFA